VEWLLGESQANEQHLLLDQAPSQALVRSASGVTEVTRPGHFSDPGSSLKSSGSGGSDSSGVEVVEDAPERLRIRSTCERACLLVISDSWAAGWRCTVDGRESPILRANYLHRAVELPAGDHEITLTYVPPGLRTGAFVSIGAIALIALAAAVGIWRGGRRASHS